MFIQRILLQIVLLCGVFMAISGCFPEKQPDPIEGTINRAGQIMAVQVIVHKTDAELQAAYRKWNYGAPVDVIEMEVHGFAIWSSEEPGQCQIHIRQINTAGDINMDTLGHEMTHCLYGEFHP